MIENRLEFILDAALCGQCALVMVQLALSDWRQPWRLPLWLVFFGAFIASLVSLLQTQWFPNLAISFVFSVPAVFFAVGGLWIYTKIITSSKPMQARPNLYLHLWPIPFCLLAALPILLLPSEVRTELALFDKLPDLYDGATTPFILSFIFLVFWMAPYLVSIILQLSRYRKRLRTVHSSLEHKTLTWINIVVAMLGVYWLISINDVLELFDLNIRINHIFEVFFDAILITTLALWGVRQTPVLEDVSGSIKEPQENQRIKTDETPHLIEKYSRSALSDTHLNRISGKINLAMQDQKLYLNPNLSLGMLAQHLGISSHYISQTLNTKMGESFFEYINRWRALGAEKELRETRKTVIEIAYNSGFNSRSAFYNAFNKSYHITPAAYRKQNQTKSLQTD